jgi:prevent-host-death family protein
MERVKIAELKDNLSHYLEHVEAGGEVVVLRRDRPVARIVPIVRSTAPADDDARIAELERLGLARGGKPGNARRWLRRYRPVKLTGRSVLAEFLEDRRSSW